MKLLLVLCFILACFSLAAYLQQNSGHIYAGAIFVVVVFLIFRLAEAI
jgi:hypothetical protein